MRIMYLDCSMGCAGDMFSGALLDSMGAGEAAEAIDELNAIGIPGVRYELGSRMTGGIRAVRLKVTVNGVEEEQGDPHVHEDEHAHVGDSHAHEEASCSVHDAHEDAGHADHHHSGHHAHRTLAQVEGIIGSLDITDEVRSDAMSIFRSIAEAEAKVHGHDVEEVHFHEVGAMDAIADVVAASYLVRRLAPDSVCASPVNVGSGDIVCAHGRLPVPVPAVAELLKGVPSYGSMGSDGMPAGELCTPTGAAIVRHMAQSFGPMPAMEIRATGYGAGSSKSVDPNAFRVILGEQDAEVGDRDKVIQIECNIDDMTPEDLGYALDVLNGSDEVLDASFATLQMKKSRPGVMLMVLVRPDHLETVARMVFEHTTTIGIRISEKERMVMEREVEERDTPIGRLRVKASSGFGTSRSKPEFDDLMTKAMEALGSDDEE